MRTKSKPNNVPIRKIWLSIISIIIITLLLVLADYTANYYEERQATKPFKPKPEVHYTKVTHNKETAKLLLELGINSGESFEIMSYTCPACGSIDPVLDYLSDTNNIPIHKFQLGSESIPMAEAEFIVASISPNNLKQFRRKMFSKMLSPSSLSDKINFAKTIPFEFGATIEQITALEVQSKAYAKNTVALADLLNVTQTPTVYINGHYKIIHSAHHNYKEYISTVSHLLNNPVLD